MSVKHILFLSCFCITVHSVKSQEVAEAVKSEDLFILSNNSENKITADSLLQYATDFLETPYRLGAAGPTRFDCSGFTSYIYKQFGYAIYRTSKDQAHFDGIDIPQDSLKRGDLVFFQGKNIKKKQVRHVGIVYEVLPNGTFTFIHASIKKGVTISESTIPYYHARYIKAKRILEEDEKPTPVPIRKSSYKSLTF